MSPNQEKILWLVQAFEEKGDGVNAWLLARGLDITPDYAEELCQALVTKACLEQTSPGERPSYRLTAPGRRALRELMVRRAESLEHLPELFVQKQEQIEAELSAPKATNK